MARRLAAVVEVVAVTAVIFLVGNWLLQTPLGAWQQTHLYYLYHGHLLFMLVPAAWLAATGRSLAAYGLTGRQWRQDVTAALTCFLPVAIAGATLGFVDYTTWFGAVVETAVQIALLFLVARALTGPPNPQSGLLTIGLALLLFGAYGWWQGLFPGVGRSAASLVYYLVFIGLGEEVLYRGFILTRLNVAFGRPWRFYGVAWGWGAVLSSLIFGFTHVLNGVDSLLWPWGMWTFFGGFVFTYVREKTGSVVAPALLHGLPQALVFMMVTAV